VTDEDNARDPISAALDRGLAAAGAWYIVDLLKLCEVPQELQDQGHELARRLGGVGGIEQQIVDRLTLMDRD
jgi:hypothetical protein